MSWTLEEFYADGGTTTFTDRVAATLGVDAWRVRTVAVYEGSVVIEFFVLADPSAEDSKLELKQVEYRLGDALTNGPAGWLGAPIIGVVSGGRTIIDEIIIPDGSTGSQTLIADWLAERDQKVDEKSEEKGESEGETGGGSNGNEEESSGGASEKVINIDVTV